MNEKNFKDAIQPGTMCGRIFFAALLFLAALLLVTIGFFKTLVVAAMALAGWYIGSTRDLKGSIGKTVGKIIPQKNRKVVYTAEDIERVKAMLKDEQAAAQKEEGAEKE